MELLVRSRDEILYNGKVKSLTSYNSSGLFDILPEHSNFISLVDKEIRFTDIDAKEHLVSLEKGILRVVKDQIQVFLRSK